MEPGTQVFVNWYGHVCAGTVLDKQKANFSGEIWKDWIAISMQVPASDGKPIVAGCHNICAYHKKHVYDTSEAAATAWREFQIRSQQTKPEWKPYWNQWHSRTVKTGWQTAGLS